MPDLTYKQLRQAVTDLAKQVTTSAEIVRNHARTLEEAAQDTARTSEMIGQMGVDSTTVAETKELSRIMNGVSEAAIAYASAGDTTAKLARAAHEQARATHSGIDEAVTRSGVDTIHQVDREWFRQE